MKKILNPWVNRPEYDCFGCSPNNPIGLHLEFYEDGDDIVTVWYPQTHYQGWIGTLHGGILCTLMDETAGWVVNRKLQTSGVTSNLEIKYRKPVKTDEGPITMRAHVIDQHRNIVYIYVMVTNDKGDVCTDGTIVYYTFGFEKAKEMGFEHCKAEDENGELSR